MTDRCVHGKTAGGDEIVRYDRSGKWYLEESDGHRELITLDRAVDLARFPGAAAFLDRPGGRRFDAKVRA